MRFNFADQIRSMIQEAQNNLFTSLPARVVTYYPDEQCVDVKPILRQRFDEHSGATEMPVIYKVPVIFPSAGGGLLSFPIFAETDETESSGDIMMLEFSMRSMEEWLSSEVAGDAIPLSNRYHNLTDAVAKPSIYQFKNHLTPHPRNTELKFQDTVISLEHVDPVTPEGGGDPVSSSNLVITTNGLQGITINVLEGHITTNVLKGNVTTTITEGDASLSVGGNVVADVGGEVSITAGGDVVITAPTINLN